MGQGYNNSRLKYCQQCNKTHIGYDHHCLWMATCIHSENYSYFMWFMVIVWAGLAAMLAIGVLVLANHLQRRVLASFIVLGVTVL